jgi:hypothetical protein
MTNTHKYYKQCNVEIAQSYLFLDTSFISYIIFNKIFMYTILLECRLKNIFILII